MTHHRTTAATLAAFLVAAALAGCITLESAVSPDAADAGGATVPPAPDFDFSTAIVNDHDHGDKALHTAHFGLELAGYSPLTEGMDPQTAPSGFTEVDVWGDWAVVASMEGNRAFTIVDISDPTHPRAVSTFHSWGENWDARFSDDGNYVFIGCQGGTPFGAYTRTTGAGACVAPNGVTPERTEGNGIMAVDVTDKANPELVAFTPSASVHNLFSATLDDGTIVVANNQVELFTFDPATHAFTKVSEVDGVHDAHIAKHPVTGQWLLYTGTQDLTVYDITDPANPVLVGAYGDGERDATGATGWHEQTPAPTLIAGRAIVVGGGEMSNGMPTPITVFDVTDPANIQVLGTWELPGGPYTPQGSYKFSAHNIDVSPTGQVAVSFYHGGVWVFDISTEERLKAPVTLGFYQPHEETVGAPMVTPYGQFVEAPYVWGGAWTDDGHLVVPDMNTGLYVLEPAFWAAG